MIIYKAGEVTEAKSDAEVAHTGVKETSAAKVALLKIKPGDASGTKGAGAKCPVITKKVSAAAHETKGVKNYDF
ncbi:MAG: hypothetical protein K6F52_00115 [Clostridia bacterium]|nr:hypothetical protein [Clostridia bacterium]